MWLFDGFGYYTSREGCQGCHAAMKTAGIFNDTSISGHYGCTAVMKTLTAELQKRGVKPAYLWPVAEDWQPHQTLLEKYRPATSLTRHR